jgi:DNA (cytosine-5)-methyltransferase 1
MRALGVSIFAGGFTLGVERHFEIAAHLERSLYGVATFKHNRPQIPVHIDKEGRWEREVEAIRAAGPVGMVYANPPCAPFSLANVTGGRGLDHPAIGWLRDPFLIGKQIEAPVVVVESVRMALKVQDTVFRPLWEEVRDYYSSAVWLLVNAYDHGLAQWRPRVFLTLSRERFQVRPRFLLAPKLLDVLDLDDAGTPNSEVPPLSAIDLGPKLGEEFLRIFPLMEQGRRIGSMRPEEVEDVAPGVAHKLRVRKLLMHLPVRLREYAPAPTVFGGGARFIHPRQDRLLTLRELSRLCGYAEDFEWISRDSRKAGGWSIKATQLGKGVCPPVGEWIAGEVAAYLRGERAVRGEGGDEMLVMDMSSESPNRPFQLDIYAAGA